MDRPKPLLLVILDGFGITLERNGNPIAEANTPTLNEIEKNFPFTTLQASSIAVGLPWGEAGNSEVGHLTIGSGRAIYHHLPRIINAIYDGSFFKNESLLKASEHVKKNNSNFHIAGLISSGSVHSYIDHLYALLEFTKHEEIKKVFVHVFSDGKDAPPKEGAKFLSALEERMAKDWPHARIGSVIGRLYALDRDEKWDRIQVAYNLLTEGAGEKISSASKHLENSYAQEIFDEFISPAAVTDGSGNILPRVGEHDALIFSDFREDSMREITHAFADESFDHFPRKKVGDLVVVTLTEYQKGLANPAFPQLDIAWPLSRILGEASLRHLHIAETQKYAHVTYFFNGGKETAFPGEERILVPSVQTPHFDEVPEMRAKEITAKIMEHFNEYDVIIANFANADMVGHSGNFSAGIKAVEALDNSLQEIMNAVLAADGAMIITGDHGNIELKRNILSGEKRTEHSVNPVPFFLVGRNFRIKKPRTEEDIRTQKKESGGIITDVAPTMIELLGLEKPQEMTGNSLLKDLLKQI